MDWLKDQYGNVEGPLGFPMRDKEARTLETILKALPKNKDFEYRKVISQKGVSEILPGERSDVSWISTESVDRAGEVVIARGMNDSQFQSNPVVTLGHAYHIPPAGKSLWRKQCKDGELRGVKAKTVYPAMPEGWKEQWMPDKVFPLVQEGLLNGKSIGFIPTKVHLADRKEAQKNNWETDTLVIDEWLMLEYACVFFPCNQDALVDQVAKSEYKLTDEMLQALGVNVEEWNKLLGQKQQVITKSDPHPNPPGRPITFTPLAEIERAVQLALEKVSVDKVIENAVKEACERRMGRV
jgi:hypothetical protein